MEINRDNLNKYYKYVKTCRLCGKLYGHDEEEERNNHLMCPVCTGALKRKVWQ